MSTSGKVLHNIVWLAIEPTLRAVISIALAGFIASRLGLVGYGQFALAVSFAVLFGPLANLGLNEVLVRAIARQPDDEATLWSSVTAAKLVLLGGYLAVVAAAAAGLGYDRAFVGVIVLMALCQGLFSLENASVSLFAGRQHVRPTVPVTLAKALLDAAVTVAVLLAGCGVLGLAASRVVLTALALLATVLMAIRLLGLRFARPSFAMVRPLLVAGLSFAGISVLIGAGARGGVLILEHVRGIEAVALFGAAMALVDRLLVFLPPIMGAVFPFFSAFRSDEPDRFRSSLARALRYQCLGAVGLGLGVALLGPWVLRVTFPRGFEGATAVIEVLGAFAVVRAVNDLLNSVTQARGLERQTALVWGVRCVANLGLAVLLVGPFGAVGLAWSLVAADAVLLALMLAVLGRRGSLGAVRWGPLSRTVAVGVLVFVAFRLVPGARESLTLPFVFVAAYPPLLVLARAVSGEDYRYLALVVRGATGESRTRSGPMTAPRGAS